MEHKIWKAIIGFNGYFVNQFGEVKSSDKIVNARHGVRKRKGKLLKQGNHNCGYRIVSLYKNSIPVNKFVHRLVVSAFLPIDKLRIDVNHKNGVKSDNRLENLEWVTRSENIIHSYKMGLQVNKKGIESKVSKLCTDGSEILNMSLAAKKSGFCLSYFSAMLNGKHINKTNFKLIYK